jgi:hypothetical protein
MRVGDAAWRRRERREPAEERDRGRELRLALSSNLGGRTAGAIWIPRGCPFVGGWWQKSKAKKVCWGGLAMGYDQGQRWIWWW